MSADVDALARFLLPSDEGVRWARATVLTVDASTHTAVVSRAGGSVVASYYAHVTVAQGDNVDLLISDTTFRILGVIA
jgi:hypothetical protein